MSLLLSYTDKIYTKIDYNGRSKNISVYDNSINMDEKIEELSKINARLVSFIDRILTDNDIGLNKQNYYKELLKDEFPELIKTEPDNKMTLTRIITSESDSYSDDEKQDKLNEMKGGFYQDIEFNLFSDDEIMKGGAETPKTSKNKSVKINTDANIIHTIDGNQPNKGTTRDKIERRLNRLSANDVKQIGGKFNIKPVKGKKYLTKTDVIDKVKKNTRIYKKVIEHINDNYEDILTES